MFAKLLKHELKSTGSLVGVLSPAALAVGIVGGFVMRTVMNAETSAEGMEGIALMAGVLLPFVFITLFAYAFGCGIYLAVQFYKRKFTDEGYLTFTLPVKTWQIYLSSLLNILLWTLVIGLVTFLSFGCMMIIAMYDTEAWHMMQEYGFDFPQQLEDLVSELDGLLAVSSVAGFVSSGVMLITSITLGSVVAKKHKILGSIACYYVISMATGVLSSVFSVMPEYSTVDMQVQLTQVYTASLVQHLIVILAGSALSIWLMDKKLNLP